MEIGRSIRRAVRPFWAAAIGAALWSNRQALLDAFQRWGRKAGETSKRFGAGDTAASGGAGLWVSRMRPQSRPAAGGATVTDATGSPAEAYEVGATW